MRGERADVLALIKSGADVNAPQGDGVTALHWAARHGDADLVAALLAAGARARAGTRFGEYTPLHLAAERGSAPIVKALRPDGRNLAVKAETRRPAPAKVLVPGVERQHKFNEQVAWQGGMTPLLYAARQGYIDVATALLDAGVAVNQCKGGDQMSALLVATVNGQFDLAGMLLDRGASPTLTAENGVAPLYAAINLMWAPRAGYPQPRAHVNQKLSYLDLMKRLLDA